MYRPIKLTRNWTSGELKDLILAIEDYLYRFTKTKVWDSGVRLPETEAYLQGLKDAKTISKIESK